MSTFEITKNVSFTYNYSKKESKQTVEGEFYTGSGADRLGVRIRVDRNTREQAIDDIQKYAEAVGLLIDGELQ